MNPQIENNFKSHMVDVESAGKLADVRDKVKELALFIDETVPNSREKSIVMTKLEEAMFWANAGISRN